MKFEATEFMTHTGIGNTKLEEDEFTIPVEIGSMKFAATEFITHRENGWGRIIE